MKIIHLITRLVPYVGGALTSILKSDEAYKKAHPNWKKEEKDAETERLREMFPDYEPLVEGEEPAEEPVKEIPKEHWVVSLLKAFAKMRKK